VTRKSPCGYLYTADTNNSIEVQACPPSKGVLMGFARVGSNPTLVISFLLFFLHRPFLFAPLISFCISFYISIAVWLTCTLVGGVWPRLIILIADLPTVLF
jgi:hypothetical protein